MSLADVTPAPPRKKGETCSVERLRDQLDDDDRATLAAWLDLPNEQMSSVEIARRLRESDCVLPNGSYIASGTISRHRRGDCQCDR